MGRTRQPLQRGQSTTFYIPEEITKEQLEWINSQKKLNQSILTLIQKEIDGYSKSNELEEIIEKVICRVAKNNGLKTILQNDKIDKVEDMSSFQKNFIKKIPTL